MSWLLSINCQKIVNKALTRGGVYALDTIWTNCFVDSDFCICEYLYQVYA